MADYTGYGLDPAIVNYVQGLGAPTDPLALQSTLGPRGTESVPGGPVAAPPPPPPPVDLPPAPGSPTGRKGGEPAPPTPSRVGLFGVPNGEETPSYGLPPEIVAHLQGAPESPPPSVPSVTGGALPTDPGLAPMQAPPAQPDYVAATPAIPTDKQIAASNKRVDQRQAAQAAYAASPEGLAARADNEQRQAIDKEQQANQDALAAEQAQNTATSNALTASAQRQAEQDKIDNARIAEQQANVDKYTQQYAQQVKDAADYKVDTNRDVGIRGLIAIALSGIGDALDHRHGPNAAAQIIESQIDKRIGDQWAQKKALGEKAQDTNGVLARFRQNADDDRQAQALHTAAETKRVADEIRQIGAQYANPAAKARAEAVAATLDSKAAAVTQNEAVRKAQAIKDAQEERDRRAQIGIAAGHLGLASKQFTEGQRQFNEDMKLKYAQLLNQGDAAGAKAVADRAAKVQELGMVDYGTVKTPDGQVSAAPKPLTNADGTVWTAPTEKEAMDLRTKRAAVENIVGLLDEVRQIRDEHGGSSDILRSPEWQRAKANWGTLKLKIKDLEQLGAISGNDVELIDGVLGANDPTSFRDVAPGLDQARKNLTSGFNKDLRYQGNYTGPDLQFPDPVANKPVKTPEQRDFQDAIEFQGRNATTADAGLTNEDFVGKGSTEAETVRRQVLAEHHGLTPHIQQVVDTIAAAAQNAKTPSERDAFASQLLDLANKAIDPSMKAYAAAKLQEQVGVPNIEENP